MIDPYHSIIINEEIGLLGNNDFEVSKDIKDYKVVDEFEMSLYNWGITDNSNVFKPAIVLYIDNKLYTNCKELDTKYKYIDNIKLIEITTPFSYMLESGKTKASIGGEYTLNYAGKTYKSHPLSQENKIYRFRNIMMHL